MYVQRISSMCIQDLYQCVICNCRVQFCIKIKNLWGQAIARHKIPLTKACSEIPFYLCCSVCYIAQAIVIFIYCQVTFQYACCGANVILLHMNNVFASTAITFTLTLAGLRIYPTTLFCYDIKELQKQG